MLSSITVVTLPMQAQAQLPRSRMVDSYAATYDVTLAEAADRLRFQKEVGEIGAHLEENEQATFGGLYIEHLPTYRVVAKFTRSGVETLAKYTQDRRFVAVAAAQTYAELRATQSALGRLLKPFGLAPSVSNIDVIAGRVRLYVVDPAVLRAARAAGTLKLPDYVEILQAHQRPSK